ncbi:mechanosensitive ion channel family protein [Candidatus Nitrotoga sp. M5]|uniref:mechanosensitive ion channel family protein n=1 Tax=Candidatus Nitrotoga sp. M5 TaxID=2890409 RepID=UPI001EF367C7|nr:mechanosensitive ion channel domain-containing protein [Candidatus Nitrotoga sp. M5]CAH1386993.1 Potassium efflux system KefA protein / Small-conductance mechanosensitive channel [Candidatus Nitrotoga sp. M5]
MDLLCPVRSSVMVDGKTGGRDIELRANFGEQEMQLESVNRFWQQSVDAMQTALTQPESYTQAAIIVLIYAFAFFLAKSVRKYAPILDDDRITDASHPILRFVANCGNLIFPLTAILLLRVSAEISNTLLNQDWLLKSALTIAMLLLLITAVNDFVGSALVRRMFKLIGIPLLLLHLLGLLDDLIRILDSISVNVGNIEISAYGIVRVAIFGSLLFWLGRISNRTGREILDRQTELHHSTREVASKLLEVATFVVIVLLLLNVMGINLTALAVFGGALGVGLGFGLQAIASNFISGLIILFDRSVTVGDFVEFDGGRAGIVRELKLRSTTLETFEGKDVIVPNEKFIVETFINWTHKDKRQRYRVDFSVAYSSDIDKLVALIKDLVASHPKVLSGEQLPSEYRPDCEIASFGDSGVNMFVEFWMEGIDDGKNRVGGDLLLMIFNALREHGFEIPFPQREVRVLNPNFNVGPLQRQNPE